ncbi:hypothetical protein NM688_g7356 [Phlebia brevispora]|uniref:Uncharacterized protein n=1 Tax=Phlebia brevispora TaxID=194682 RepID=A0ACC1S6B3_9APHY|nr:hypothetical protein NM688_g7356 [Phlebia brevispora]
MSEFATQVVQLLDEYRRISLSGEQPARELVAVTPAVDEHRPPKRPWEDMERDNQGTPSEADIRYDEASQSTAEQDMEIIRSKRATSSTGTTPGQTKSKYRKRSRATPPGKCHSCNIRETPEWRRGPDGARTLCNACGLHYAKLMRKREKTLGADGKPVPIDLQTLRMSTLASKEHGKGHHHDPSRQPGPDSGPQQAEEQGPGAPAPSAYEPSKQSMQPQPHPSHGGGYQTSSVSAQGAPPPAPSPHQMMHPPPLQSQGQPVMPPPPQSPWMASPSSRGFPASSEPAAYMRPPHSTATHTRGSPQ